MTAKKEASVSIRRRTAFSTIPNALIRDVEISPEARLLLCYIMSCSDSWTFYVSECQRILGCKKDKWQRIRREVIEAGYLRVHAKNGENGRLEGYIWEVFDEPQAPDAVSSGGSEPQDAGENGNHREPEKPATGAQPVEPSHREPEKPARRLNPPAGKTGPIRKNNKQKEKQTSCADQSAPTTDVCSDNLLKDFERVFPKLATAKATLRAISRALESGATAEQIIGAAEAYAAEQQGNAPRYIRRADRFFEDGFWQTYVPAQPATPSASETDFVEHWAKTIRSVEMGHFMFGKISPDTAAKCIRAGKVTAADCRRAGLRITDAEAQAMLEVAQ
ncbi:hypothetical protein TM1040_1315 [Ruegeria sp. TM1040]|uniref:helix-turn-helix domain-containing protein n=1 Tax=Ruegeria sp. (strain TM1040) TaxID=292414 RepID=UPI00004624B7|nr:helix-turn-helix domain-containing protein [Ruegeria sp. TM1040]ABF64048.1 hypothetical protein TM1040_1315 [Ruegeria sp. TM1040]